MLLFGALFLIVRARVAIRHRFVVWIAIGWRGSDRSTG